MNRLRHFVHNQVVNVHNAVTDVPKQSKFEEKRMLTPDEFVIAGDHLVGTVGSWEWAAGEESKRVPYLPADKQYLVTKNVPCRQRASSMRAGVTEMAPGEDGDWVCAASNAGGAASTSGAQAPRQAVVNDMNDDDDDADTFKPHAAAEERRSYDLYITYSKYFQVPQFWLAGYAEDKTQLSVKQMQEDISADHMEKTVTVDPFPHMKKLMAISIHPCKHAVTMKLFGDRQVENGRAFPVAHYLILFLKFISGIVPTVEYDYSMEYDMS